MHLNAIEFILGGLSRLPRMLTCRYTGEKERRRSTSAFSLPTNEPIRLWCASERKNSCIDSTCQLRLSKNVIKHWQQNRVECLYTECTAVRRLSSTAKKKKKQRKNGEENFYFSQRRHFAEFVVLSVIHRSRKFLSGLKVYFFLNVHISWHSGDQWASKK